MGTNTTSPTLNLDYDLIEDYVLAPPLGAFTSLAAVTGQNGAEVFVIGGANLDTVNHVYPGSASNTWGYSSLQNVPDGNTIVAIAAAVGSDGRRAVAIATDGSNLYVTLESEAYSGSWNSWAPVAQLNVSQLTLRVCDGAFQLGAVVQSAVYGDVTRWLVYSAELQFDSSDSPEWVGVRAFFTDLCVCDFIVDSTNQVLVTGCVSPTLSLFPVYTFSEWIWSTSGNSSFGTDIVSIYCPLPSDPTAAVISPLVLQVEQQYPPATPPPSVLCAGSIEDLSSRGPTLLTLATAGATKTWGDEGAGTTLDAALFEPVQMTNYENSSEPPKGPAISWFMNPTHGDLPWYDNNPSSGIIQFDQNTQINFGLIRDTLLVETFDLNQVFTTAHQPPHNNLTIFAFDSPEFSIPNCYIANADNFDSNPVPPAKFPAAAVTRLSGVLLTCPSGEPGPISSIPCSNTNLPAFSNWCQVVKDGAACAFAVDDSGNLWFLQSENGAWQNLSTGWTTAPNGGFSPSSPDGITLSGMQASDGTVQVFAVGADGAIYQISETGESTNTFNVAKLLAGEFGSIALAPAPPKTVSPCLFAISNNSTPPVLYYISTGPNMAACSQVNLETPTQQLQQVTAYTVDAHLQDAYSALMGDQQVTLQSTLPCTAVVNGVPTRLIAGDNTLYTNSSGGLHLVIPTTSISAPALTFYLAGGNEPVQVQIVGGGGVPVTQVPLNSKVLQRLADLTLTDFTNAVDIYNTHLFQPGSVANVYDAVHGLTNALQLGGAASSVKSLPQSAASGWICGQWDDFKK